MGERFRAAVEQALRTLPILTPAGRVAPSTVDVHMGYPGGSHDIEPAWVYERAGTTLEMAFRFYENFTPNDLICKVVVAGEYPQSGEGASVQFNSDRCVVASELAHTLVHHGEVTVRTRVTRTMLVRAIEEICPREMDLAGIKNSNPSSWPVRIGTSADVPGLLDNLFVFAYCIEQAKRRLRNESPLPTFGSTEA